MINTSTVLLLFALLALVIGSPLLWFDEIVDEDGSPMNLRGSSGFRMMMPNQLDSSTSSLDSSPSRRLLKRANVMFNKRRGRELFGKRSLPMGYPDESVMLENRFRRRANELFG